MYPIEVSSVVQWTNTDDGYYPLSLDVDCPHCGRRANFTTSSPLYDINRQTLGATGKCAACQRNIYIWTFNPYAPSKTSTPGCEQLLIHPQPRNQHPVIDGFDLLPEPIQRAYRDTVIIYNTGVYSATATLCRRTLEGIVNELQEGEQNGNLYNRLEGLSKSLNLATPLITLSHAVRKAGNLGAHYNLEREPDKATVQATIELIEYLLEYVYTLPGRIDKLNAHIDGLGKETPEDEEEQAKE